MKNKIKKIILLFGDLVFLHLSLLLTLIIRYSPEQLKGEWNNHLPKFVFVFIIFLISLYINNFYNLNMEIKGRKFFRRLTMTIVFSSFFSIIYFYLATEQTITPKTNLLIFYILFSLLLIIWRYLFRISNNSFSKKQGVAIIGNNEKSNNILKEIRLNPGHGYDASLLVKDVNDIYYLPKFIIEKNIKNVVICDDFNLGKEIRKILFSCFELNVNFFSYPDFYEHISGKVPVEEIDVNWFLDNLKEGEKSYFNSLKNIFDYFFSFILLLITLPFWPIIAILIKIESYGPVFFKQKRMGLKGKPFIMIKFRTMTESENDGTMTVEGDVRITRLGNILRKTRLDEIPQLLNILKGEMSFIGPRPERPEFIENLEKEIPFYNTRLLVKPGLSGWDQVSGEYHSASAKDTLKKLQNDLFYIKNRSLYLDTIIILKTISAILNRAGR